jgi:hypothetical protein
LSVEVLSELTVEDILALEGQEVGAEAAPLKKLRQSHHQLARLISEGYKDVEASAMTGYSPSRISILKNDPAFAELITYYQEVKTAVYLDVHERIQSVAVDALEELHERVTENPDGIKNEELIKIVTSALDRAGHGPTSKVESRSIILTSEDLMRMKAETEERQKGSVKVVQTKIVQAPKASPDQIQLPKESGPGSGGVIVPLPGSTGEKDEGD